MTNQCCMCKAQQTKLAILEAKLDAIEFFFSRVSDEDAEIAFQTGMMPMEDPNLENLLKQLSVLNQCRGV